jgi:hypothetical protein
LVGEKIDRYGYEISILFESLQCTPSLASWAAPLVEFHGLYATLKRASLGAETRYTKNEDPMGHVLVTWKTRNNKLFESYIDKASVASAS